MPEILMEVRNLCKYYAGVKAIDDISISFFKGEIHALAGENGAGKSTLIKAITGAIEPTSGEIVIEGQSYQKLTPIEAIHHGIAAIYQEFTLIPYLSIAENVFLGKEIMQGAFINKQAMNEEVRKALDDMGIHLKPASLVKDLGVAHQQIVEIVKAIMSDSKILIMDEPTAPLTNNETKILFKLIEKLKEKEVTILFITHRMEEIFKICDRVTVMRDGQFIVTENVEDISMAQLIKYMVGRDLGENFPLRTTPMGEEILTVQHYTSDKINDVCFSLHRGEILGFGGLVGAGRTEIMQCIFGADKINSGSLKLNGKEISINNPGSALRHGIGLIPEDRKNQGVLLSLSVKENISFSSLMRIAKRWFINDKKDISLSEYYVDKLRIKTPNIKQLVNNLSGGNQQKVVLAKMLATECDIIIFDEPTRGIDVGAKQEIYQLIRHLADVEGKSIIIVSSEMPELIGMSDRILIIRQGKIVGELQRQDFSQELILEYASGTMEGEYHGQ